MKLYIGNKNYSSWSMRSWTLMRHFDIPFEEVKILFDGFTPDSNFKQSIKKVNPTGTVPVLTHAGAVISDTLAIAEYLAEYWLEAHPGQHLWPDNRAARAQARGACAEMHAGFRALRSKCPMNIEASLPEVGALVMRDDATVRADVARIVQLWTGLLDQYASTHADQMLFGAASTADFYFAPVVMRLKTYGIPVPSHIAAYMQRVCALKGVKAWMDDALAEHEFRDFEEPYRLGR